MKGYSVCKEFSNKTLALTNKVSCDLIQCANSSEMFRAHYYAPCCVEGNTHYNLVIRFIINTMFILKSLNLICYIYVFSQATCFLIVGGVEVFVFAVERP